MDSGKGRYGLIMPKKLPQKNLVSTKLSVFADDSDDEPSVGESLQKEALKKQAMKQTKLEIQKALEEDATVYEYDSIYDEMQQQKKESNARILSGKDDKKPRYIQNLLKAAEIRKKEQEKRMERKIQKEREMEGGEFDHKEAFVTSAYKKKLQERAEEEEREKREAALEAYLDVTKQKDLSGFYRHLLNQTVGEEEMPKCSFREARIKEEKSDSYVESNQRNKCPYEKQRLKPSAKKENNPDADTDLETDSSDDGKRHKNSKMSLEKKRRRESSVSSEEEAKHHKKSPNSSSAEEELHAKAQTSHLAKRGESRLTRRGNDEQYREKDYEKSRTHERDHQRVREERHRYGDHGSKDNYRRREEQDDKQRGKERKEREGHEREWRKAKERGEKGSEKEREKERTRSDKDRYNNREKERGEKCREKEDHVKERREKYSSDEKKYRERREGTPASLEKGGETDLEKERKGKEKEVDEKGRPISGMLPEQKRKAEEEKEQSQKPSETVSKFAKRSNEETVMSARDRYLARQMARVSTKSYIEKEED
ncbi:nuclear speckle splicing regulatory protein 1-like isoform X2 [Colius striatus]|uniref:nuclear speckle splicing regulatory protein 1-like isoform X2 n=1 Tax=Colius striatus TaxID=57412 RepID=UPI0005297BB4|nr:nuclear speckle splicing regulatory protein 1-like isoform X2 [Colius striatus]